MYNIPAETAGIYISIIYIVAAFTTPLMGKWIDNYGYRGIMISITLILILISHLMLLFFPKDICTYYLIIPMVLLGLYYSV